MQESLASAGLWIVVVAALAAGLGFAIGRVGGATARRLRALQVALVEERAAHDKARRDYDGYRKQVADHFSETSEHLHDLTLQYRAVYEHLAKGATELCPEGFSKLEGGLGLDALPEEIAQGPAPKVAQRSAPDTSVKPPPRGDEPAGETPANPPKAPAAH